MNTTKLSIIDIHTHLFNLNYLPVRGILQSYGIPYPVAALTAFLLKQITDNPKNKLNKTFFDEELDSFPIELLKADDDDIINHLSMNVSEETFFHPTFQLHLNNAIIQGYIDIDDESKSFIYGEEKFSFEFIQQKIFSIVKKILELLKDGFDYIKWFFFMMRSEDKILNMLLSSYSNDVDQFVFHMMDPRYFFPGKPRLSMKDKIKRMHKLIQENENKLIGFVAFNPKRRTKKGIELIEYALKKGFKGVKFYPPLGYRASQNEKQIKEYYDIPNGKKIEARVSNFFEYCVDGNRDIPVFTHCTPDGFEAVPQKNSGRSSDPIFWENLLNKPGMKNLRVCLGHAGGEKGWAASNEEDFINSYAYKVYQLCIKFPNVYCEVGFLAHIKNDSERKNFIKRLQNLFSKKEGDFHFAKKIMYGSDWHILFNDGLQLDYHKEFINIFRSDILCDYKQDFFALNAKRYLKTMNV